MPWRRLIPGSAEDEGNPTARWNTYDGTVRPPTLVVVSVKKNRAHGDVL